MANNKEMLKNFFSLYNKQCIKITLHFNDGSSTIYSDYGFTSSLIEDIKNHIAKQLTSTYCKEPRKKEMNEDKG